MTNGTYNLDASFTNGSEVVRMKGTVTVTITIESPITIDPVEGVVGKPLPPLVADSGSGGPYTFALTADSKLPPGITALDSDGKFEGIATTPGTFSIGVDVADSQG